MIAATPTLVVSSAGNTSLVPLSTGEPGQRGSALRAIGAPGASPSHSLPGFPRSELGRSVGDCHPITFGAAVGGSPEASGWAWPPERGEGRILAGGLPTTEAPANATKARTSYEEEK